MYRNFLKPVFDYSGTLLIALLLAPLFLLVSVISAFMMKGKPFFYQERAGKNGIPFKMIKFRTMTDQRDHKGDLLPNNARLTPYGKFLRKFSIDEIPQLINVLKGDMRLIGPRPLHVKYLPLYNDHQKRRHEIPGGITGWAQVNGRNTISWEKKFEYDVWYIDNQSLLLDLKILWLTFLKVLRKEDINLSDKITMTSFKGTKE